MSPAARAGRTRDLARLLAWTGEHWGLAVFVLALVLRCGFCIAAGPWTPPTDWGDDADYDAIAGGLAGPAHVYQNTWFPPGYPFFLAMIYGLAGPATKWAAVRLIQAVLSAATCWVTYAIARNTFGLTAGRVAGLLLALYPGHIYMAWRLMAETLFTLLIALAVLAAQRAAANLPEARRRGSSSLWSAAGAGVALGAATLMKSNLLVLVPLLVGWLGLALQGTARRKAAAAAVATGGCVLLLAALPLANRLSPAHRSAWLPGNSGPTLWWSNNPLADGYFVDPDGTPAGRAFIERHHLAAPAIRARDPSVRDRADRELALDWIRENPGAFLALAGRKLWNAFGPLPRSALFSRERLAGWVQAIAYGAMLPFIAAGLWLARRCWRQAMPLYLVVGSYAAMTVVFYGTPRFTLVVMPYLVSFAGLAIAAAAARWLRWPRWPRWSLQGLAATAGTAAAAARRRRSRPVAGGARAIGEI